MADQGEASRIVNTEKINKRNALRRSLADTEKINKRDALRRSLADIESRAKKLLENVDVKTEDAARHVKVCERELQSLQREFYTLELQVHNCICEDPTTCRRNSCTKLEDVSDILIDVQTSIWHVYAKRVDELGHRKSMLREAIQMVQGLPHVVSQNHHLDEHCFCELCWDDGKGHDLPRCHLPCGEDLIFHRVCLKTQFEYIASINYQAFEMKNEITRKKLIYEADPDNRADDFAFQLYVSLSVLESLDQEFSIYENRVDYCKCDNPSPECNTYHDPLKKVDHIILEIINLIRECWSCGLQERAERLLERKIMEVVEGLPGIRITENHVNQKVECVICLAKYEAAEEPCHLPCNEGHLFHRSCIADWFKRKNHCPLCRMAAYRPDKSAYSATMGILDSFSDWL